MGARELNVPGNQMPWIRKVNSFYITLSINRIRILQKMYSYVIGDGFSPLFGCARINEWISQFCIEVCCFCCTQLEN